MVRSYFTGAGKSIAEPSYDSSRALSPAAVTWSASSSTPATPEPETAWYVEAIRRTRPASSWSGLSTGIAAMVVQLGLAMMRRPDRASSIAPGLTSLTTSGTSSSIRKADELSTTTTPASANRGAWAREVVAPAENSAMSSPLGSAVEASSTVISVVAEGSTVPAERAEAKYGTLSAG